MYHNKPPRYSLPAQPILGRQREKNIKLEVAITTLAHTEQLGLLGQGRCP